MPFCDCRIWLDRAHVVPHREGGSREARNTNLYCTGHHDLFDWGLLKMEGTPDDPVYKTADGEIIGRRGPRRRNRGPPE